VTAPVLVVKNVSRSFRVPVRGDGAFAAVRHFFSRQYKDKSAVKDVSFTVAAGERVGFLGQNGAGKTTTLKMLSGLLLPSGGEVVVCGLRPFDRTPAFLRQIALVMGNKQQLLWDLPAKDSFRLNAALYGIDDAELAKRVDELKEMLGLDGLLDQPVRKLSLGERMKCELLAALLHRPQVLFLDEPTLGLDVNAQVAVREFLKRYNEATGATLLLTSHYMADITALCARVLVIHEGGLIFDGDLRALTSRFAPHKEITVELDRDVTASDVGAVVDDAVTVKKTDGRVLTFAVAPHALNAALNRILALKPQDLSVKDPPIEDVIGQAIRGDAPAAPSTSTTAAS
jgi:ABC-2 type transport system ATP-binding protein